MARKVRKKASENGRGHANVRNGFKLSKADLVKKLGPRLKTLDSCLVTLGKLIDNREIISENDLAAQVVRERFDELIQERARQEKPLGGYMGKYREAINRIYGRVEEEIPGEYKLGGGGSLGRSNRDYSLSSGAGLPDGGLKCF